MNRVYIITTETFPYGMAATQRIKCYAKSIAEMGNQCKVLCVNRCEDPLSPLGNTKTKGYLDGYNYYYVGKSTIKDRNIILRYYHNFLDTIKLIWIALISFNRNDKVILYTYNGKLIRLIQKLSKIRKFKLYFEINEHPIIHKNVFNVEGETPRELSKIKKLAESFDGILCISSQLKHFFISIGIPDNKVHIVNMLIDSSRFDRLYKQETEPYIGYCGAASNNKDGVNNLILAFSKICHKHESLKLYIIGPKRPDCKNEELVNNLGIGGSVFFTGIVSPEQIPQMLLNAQVLALARPNSIQAQYGFPTKLGEYLSTGNPVVVSTVGDIPHFLKDGVSAFLVEPDNIDAFADKLDYVLSHVEEAIRVGECGRHVAEECFSYKIVKTQLKVALGI